MSTDTPKHRQIYRELERQERYPWLLLTKCFFAATNPQVLALAAIGALATTAGWRLADRMLLKDATKMEAAHVDYDSGYFSKWPGQRLASVRPLKVPLLDEAESNYGAAPDDPLFALPYRFVGPAIGFMRRDSNRQAMAYYLLGGLWTALVWAGFGGAITRMAARRYTRDDVVGVGESLKFAQGKLFSFVGGVLGPLAAVVALAIPIMLLGLAMRTDIGAAAGGLIWLFVVPLGLVMAIILLGLLFGWPLVWGAIATESSDAFDAVSRSYSYTLQRPLQYLGYTLVALVLGLLGWCVVWIVSEIMANVGLWAAGVAAGHDRIQEILAATSADAPRSLVFGGTMIWFWNGLIRTLASAYGYSYFWCAIAAIYLLLRKNVDGVELDEIALETEQQYGLPTLERDELGMPKVVDQPPAADVPDTTSP
jgi:hypothetical protein